MKEYSFHPLALAELEEAALYYNQKVPALGLDLYDEVTDALGQIRRLPESCPKIGARTRRKVVRRFPYNLIYWVDSEILFVIAVAHQKRHPGYWADRL